MGFKLAEAFVDVSVRGFGPLTSALRSAKAMFMDVAQSARTGLSTALEGAGTAAHGLDKSIVGLTTSLGGAGKSIAGVNQAFNGLVSMMAGVRSGTAAVEIMGGLKMSAAGAAQSLQGLSTSLAGATQTGAGLAKSMYGLSHAAVSTSGTVVRAIGPAAMSAIGHGISAGISAGFRGAQSAVASSVSGMKSSATAAFGAIRHAAHGAFAAVRSEAQRASSALGGIVSKLTSVKGLLLGLAGAGGIMAMGAAIVGGSVKGAANLESSEVAFKTMLGGGETGAIKAKGLMKDVSKFAAETPMELPELVSATRKLLAFGSSEKGVMKDLQMMGDVASGIQQPIGEIAEIYGKARVQGRLFAEDVNQFTGRGIPIIQELAKQFGVAESEVKKLVEKGKVGFPEMEKAFQAMTGQGGKFYKMMDEQSKTAAGLWSTFSDNVHLVGREIGGAVMPAVKALLSCFIDLTNNSANWVEPIKAKLANLSNQFVANLPAIVGGIKTIGAYVASVVGVIGSFYGAYFRIEVALLRGLLSLTGSVKGLGKGFLDAMENLKFFFDNFETYLLLGLEHTKLFASNSYERMKTFFQNVGIVLKWLWDNWKNVFQTIWDFTKTVIENLGKNLGEFFMAVKDWMRGKGFDFKWTGLLEGFESSLSEMPEMMKAKIRETTPELNKLYDELGRARRKYKDESSVFADGDHEEYRVGGGDGGEEKKNSTAASGGKIAFHGLVEFAKHIQGGAKSVAEKQAEDRDKKKVEALQQIAANTKPGNQPQQPGLTVEP